MTIYPGNPLSTLPIVSELDNLFVETHIDSMYRLLQPSAFSITGTRSQNIDVMCKTKSERELRHRKECAAKKLIDAFHNYHSIKVCTSNHLRIEHCSSCELPNPLAVSDMSRELKKRRKGRVGDPKVTVDQSHHIDSQWLIPVLSCRLCMKYLIWLA